MGCIECRPQSRRKLQPCACCTPPRLLHHISSTYSGSCDVVPRAMSYDELASLLIRFLSIACRNPERRHCMLGVMSAGPHRLSAALFQGVCCSGQRCIGVVAAGWGCDACVDQRCAGRSLQNCTLMSSTHVIFMAKRHEACGYLCTLYERPGLARLSDGSGP